MATTLIMELNFIGVVICALVAFSNAVTAACAPDKHGNVACATGSCEEFDANGEGSTCARRVAADIDANITVITLHTFLAFQDDGSLPARLHTLQAQENRPAALMLDEGDQVRFDWWSNANVYLFSGKAAFDSCDFARASATRSTLAVCYLNERRHSGGCSYL